MFIHSEINYITEIEHLARMSHHKRQVSSLARRHSIEQNSHSKCRGLIISYLTRNKTLNKELNLVSSKLAFIAFLDNDIDRAHKSPNKYAVILSHFMNCYDFTNF